MLQEILYGKCELENEQTLNLYEKLWNLEKILKSIKCQFNARQSDMGYLKALNLYRYCFLPPYLHIFSNI